MADVLLHPRDTESVCHLLERVSGAARRQEQEALADLAAAWAPRVQRCMPRRRARAVADVLRAATSLRLSQELRWRVNFWAGHLARL